MNGQTSGAISGAASGASIGFQVGGGYGAAIGAVVGAVGGLVSGGAADAQVSRARDIQLWNTQQQYNQSMNNLATQSVLSMYNAELAMLQGKLEASKQLSTAYFNADLIQQTTEYNNNLLDNELTLLWDKVDLDINLLGQQRAVERGEIRAAQSASGVVMDYGSYADVMVDSKTQQALDEFIVRHNADVTASKIENTKAQNAWKGAMEAIKVSWEGEKAATISMANSQLQAQSILFGGAMNYMSGSQSAMNKWNSGMIGVDNSSIAYSQQNTSNMMNGLFSAASRYASTYGSNYVPDAQESTASVSSYEYATQGHPAWERTNPYLN
jgi:hypothetical protein